MIRLHQHGPADRRRAAGRDGRFLRCIDRTIVGQRPLQVQHLRPRGVVGQNNSANIFEGLDGRGHTIKAFVDLVQAFLEGRAVAGLAGEELKLELDDGAGVV
jgi:hypothetical protein